MKKEMIGRGFQLHKSGKIRDAIKIYEEVEESFEPDARLFFLLGTAYYQAGLFKDGEITLRKSIVLDPEKADTYGNRGNLLQDMNDLSGAIACYTNANIISPRSENILYNKGNLLLRLEKEDDALLCYEAAIMLNPMIAEAYCNRANILVKNKRWEDALASYDNAIRLNAVYDEAFYNRGNLLKDMGRYDAAVKSYNHAIKLNPGFAEARSNKGVVLQKLNEHLSAISCLASAIVIKPECADFYSAKATALHETAQFDKEISIINAGLIINPNDPVANWNKSLLLMLTGKYIEGWKLFEWRWKRRGFNRFFRNDKSLPTKENLLDGSNIVHLYHEQGLGDTIQFSRYAKNLVDAGTRVILEVQDDLRELMSSMDPRIQVISTGEEAPNFNYQAPLLTLPHLMKTSADNIPASIPYLAAPTAKKVEWSGRLGKKTKPRIGLVWSGNLNYTKDSKRSIPLKIMAHLIQDKYEWHSLQKEYREEDTDLMADLKKIGQHQPLLRSFSDTAALIEEMDLVISVDTSVAHLAGALGKPVWILLPFVPDYRWMLEREDSPWYPTAKLYRQDADQSWGAVLERLRHDLYDKNVNLWVDRVS